MIGATAATATTATTIMTEANLPSVTSPNPLLLARTSEAMDHHPKSPDLSTASVSNSLESECESTLETCLFCDKTSPSLESNYIHMQTAHRLQIPCENHLIVDLETLVQYLRLVICDYHECIYCHTQRNSLHAVQQHMRSKDHCQIDIERDDSEFLEFYDFDQAQLDSEDDGQDDESDEEVPTNKWTPLPRDILTHFVEDDMTMRLPSGKVLVNRKGGSSTPARRHNHRETPSTKRLFQAVDGAEVASPSEAPEAPITEGTASSELIKTSPSTRDSQVSKQTKSQKKLIAQLANMREADRRALTHLSPPQQRALVIASQKQMGKAERATKRFGGKMDSLGNLNMTERWLSDVPFGRKHRTRFPH